MFSPKGLVNGHMVIVLTVILRGLFYMNSGHGFCLHMRSGLIGNKKCRVVDYNVVTTRHCVPIGGLLGFGSVSRIALAILPFFQRRVYVRVPVVVAGEVEIRTRIAAGAACLAVA